MGLLLLMAAGARANDEYVNPRFCYRIVQPAGVSRVIQRADGSGITMELDGTCPGPACVSVALVAGYARHADDLPHAHAYYRTLGWVAGHPVKRTIAGRAWITYPMTMDGAVLDIHEYVRRRGEAAYVVSARYPPEAGPQVRREVRNMLASWRWVSACI